MTRFLPIIDKNENKENRGGFLMLNTISDSIAYGLCTGLDCWLKLNIIRHWMNAMENESRLTATELSILLGAVENISSPLITVGTKLWDSSSGLPSESAFTAGATLAALLQDNLLPIPAQRLVAIYVLYDIIIARYVW